MAKCPLVAWRTAGANRSQRIWSWPSLSTVTSPSDANVGGAGVAGANEADNFGPHWCLVWYPPIPSAAPNASAATTLSQPQDFSFSGSPNNDGGGGTTRGFSGSGSRATGGGSGSRATGGGSGSRATGGGSGSRATGGGSGSRATGGGSGSRA